MPFRMFNDVIRSRSLTKLGKRPIVFAMLVGVQLMPALAIAQINQVAMLTANNEVQFAGLGQSVSVSADGNTAIIGGPGDSNALGAAWIFTQTGGVWTQGPKLVGSNASTPSFQGFSVAMSGDGNTAIVGGYNNNAQTGAAWIFVRSNGTWVQQGDRLVGNGAIGAARQGYSVAISGDGSTAIVGGDLDNSGQGAAWVFVRVNGIWQQQGLKLVGNDAVGNAAQGISVGLSEDGNTAVVGGFTDNNGAGATWIYTRSNGTWTQQGPKLVGAGAIGNANQGVSVGISGDGNTVLVGGQADNNIVGAAWIFSRSNGVWQLQTKLIASDATGQAAQGVSVAISRRGDVAAVGAPQDFNGVGAFWIFDRRNGTWTQSGSKLTESGGSGFPQLGTSIALSATSRIIIAGGPVNASAIGAAWVFTRRRPSAHDFDGDFNSDILWRANTGDIAMWFMDGTTLEFGAGVGSIDPNWQIVKTPTGLSDFNGDGRSDILWHHTNGSVAIWLMSAANIASGASLGVVDTAWQIAGVGDFNGDGKADILWRHSSGSYAIWFMNGTSVAASSVVGAASPSWQVSAIDDLNGDGKADIVLRNTSTGDVAVWLMNGPTIISSAGLGVLPSAWQIVGTGDFDGDGKADILWRHSSGALAMWFMNGTSIASAASVGAINTAWNVASTGSYHADGKTDILWRSSGGDVAMWLMNGVSIASSADLGVLPLAWSIVE